MNRLLLLVLFIQIFLWAAEKKDNQIFRFRLETDKFDGELSQFYKNATANIVDEAEERDDHSDLAQLYREMEQEDLNRLLEDNEISHSAVRIYRALQERNKVKVAFELAKKARDKGNDEERQQFWRAFRLTGAVELSALRDAEMPGFKDPTSKSPKAIKELLTYNKEVKLTPKERKLYKAYCIVLLTLQQNHRLEDLENYKKQFVSS